MIGFNNLKGKTFILGVGAQKAGTTWLYDYLRSHPEVAISPLKELHYFDQIYRPDLCGNFNEKFKARARKKWAEVNQLSDLEKAEALWPLIDRVRMINNPRAYLEYFDRLASGAANVVGEITPSYSILPEAAFAKIRAMLTDAGCRVRVIFIMRDPCERFWSQLRFYHAKGYNESPEKYFASALKDPQYVERTRYDLTLSRIEQVFQPEELSYHFYETLFQDSEVANVCKFLQIKMAPTHFDRVLNASPKMTMSDAQRQALRGELEPVYAALASRFGAVLPQQWRQ